MCRYIAPCFYIITCSLLECVIMYIIITNFVGNHPNLPDLMTHVAGKTPTKWYEVGIQLNIEISTLDAFEEQTKNQKRLYSKVFDQWKKEKKLPYTWDTIVNALEKVEENETVIAIKKWLRGAGENCCMLIRQTACNRADSFCQTLVHV